MIVFILTLIPILLFPTESIRSCAVTAIKKAVEDAVLVVTSTFKAPPPTRSFPLSVWFLACALLVVLVTLVKLGVIREGCKTVIKALCWSVQSINTFIRKLHSNLGKTCATHIIASLSNLDLWLSLIPLLIESLGYPFLAFGLASLILELVQIYGSPTVPPAQPVYGVEQTDQASLPDPDSLLYTSTSRTTSRPVNGLGVKQSIDITQLRFVKCLGAGAFGEVIEAELLDKTRAFAVKRISKVTEKACGLAVWEGLCSEVHVHSIMQDQPAFPTLHGLYHDKTHFYLVMDLGHGSFADFRPTSRLAAILCGIRLVEAVHALHHRGVVHLDIKPGNLVFGADEKPMLIDYGLAHQFDLEEPQPANFPRWHQLRQKGDTRFPMLWPDAENPHRLHVRGGTPGYMSPPALEHRPCSYGADLWAVGMVLYEWLTLGGWPTFNGTNWVPTRDHGLAKEHVDFFYKIFACEKPHRFEDWYEVMAHPMWRAWMKEFPHLARKKRA
ncbi:Serine/threonine-protein phosphatase [Mycena sanguinolenta]|uniref:Serine/threonine-protein phosphatase n=1 Tax=Mycena sanguinolenta TaxID=230812 RepID=A0A8H6ZHS5_9AGAR|nr:Serine/threonine-protein phosphatase [Mycena sanguinolenta]